MTPSMGTASFLMVAAAAFMEANLSLSVVMKMIFVLGCLRLMWSMTDWSSG